MPTDGQAPRDLPTHMRMRWRRAGSVAAAVLAVAGGVATNRVAGPWWAQALWFAGAVGAALAAARLSPAVRRSNVPIPPRSEIPGDVRMPPSLEVQSIGTVTGGVVVGPNADLRGSTFHVAGQPPVKGAALEFVRIALDPSVAEQWRAFKGTDLSVGDFHYSYSIKESEFATNLVPIFDVTVLNRGSKPAVITAVGIEILIVAHEMRVYGIPTAARIPMTEHYTVEIPDVWSTLPPPTPFDPVPPTELMLDCTADIGDPVYVPAEGPFRFGLRLERYGDHMPNIAVIRLVLETELGPVKSANIGIGRC